MNPTTRAQLVDFLSQFVSEQKLARLDEVLANRTRYLSVLLEEIYQPHNASACIRSCDCFGVQDIHIIEERNQFQPNKDVTMGSTKWVSLHCYGPDTGLTGADAVAGLKAAGYRLAATTLRPGAIPLSELDLSQKTVLCFGTEEQGLSEALHEAADVFVHIPMVGFTQSFNISVSVALCLYEMTGRLRQSDAPWQLEPLEQERLRYEWIKLASNQGDALVRRFLSDHGLPLDSAIFPA